MIWFRKTLILAHRYLGIVLSLMFVMWFVTGIGMIYSRGMPRLTPQVRLSRLSPLDLSNVKLSASEAAAQAGLDQPGGRFRSDTRAAPQQWLIKEAYATATL